MSDVLPPLSDNLDLSTIQSTGPLDVPSSRDIDIKFFSHRGRKSTQLIGNISEANFIKARREWMDFDFIDIIYVTTIEVFATGYEEYHELELSYEDFLSKGTNTERVKFDNGSFRFTLNRFLGGFGLRPNERWFKDSKLTRIEVSGIEQRAFADVLAILNNLNAEKQKIETHLLQYLEKAKAAERQEAKLADDMEQLELSLDESGRNLTNLSNEIAFQNKNLEDVRKQVAISEAVKRNVDEQAQIAKNNNDLMAKNSQSLTNEIAEKDAKLRKLENDINLFPTEIAGYVAQGARNVSLYAWLCIVPLLVIIVVTIRLFLNSEKILSYVYNEHFGIFEFLISRLPYVVVSAVVLAVCYTLLHRLITEIIGINRRRQDLFKISIIATDTSYASQTGLELSDEDRYNLRTQTKMELLKEHLKQHIGEDYVYNPKSSIVHKLSKVVASAISDDGNEAAEVAPSSKSKG